MGTGSPAGAAAQDNGGDSDDVMELTEAINEDGSTRHLAPIGTSARPATALPYGAREALGGRGIHQRMIDVAALAASPAIFVDGRRATGEGATAAVSQVAKGPS